MFGNFEREFCADLFAAVQSGLGQLCTDKSLYLDVPGKSWPDGRFRFEASGFFVSTWPEEE
jgi:hypothetical protein